MEGGGIAQWFEALVVVLEDLGLSPSTIWCLELSAILGNLNFRGSKFPLLTSTGTRYTHGSDIQVGKTPTNIK